MKKILVTFITILLIFIQTIAYAIDVEIPGMTPDLQEPLITSISLSSQELSPTEPVKIIAEISDELSGFNKGEITYTKPNGQILKRPFLLNTATGKYEAYISVTEIDVAGEWKAHSIFLEDNKQNSVNLTNGMSQTNGEKVDFTTLSLNVSGVALPVSTDKLAPVLKYISVATSQLSIDDKIAVTAEVADDESGVASVEAIYRKPSGKTKTIRLGLKNGQYYGEYSIGKYDESGSWILQSVVVSDIAGNSKYITSYIDNEDNSKNLNHCNIEVVGTIKDSQAPLLHEIAVTSLQVKAKEGIGVKASISDDESGVSFVTVNYKTPNGQLKSLYLHENANGDYVGSYLVGQYEENGKWILTSVVLHDAVGNVRTITGYVDLNDNSKDFNHCTVTVAGTTPDWEGPEFVHGEIEVQQTSTQQATVKLMIEVEDQLSGISGRTLYGAYRKPSGKLLNLYFTKLNNQYTAYVQIDKYDEFDEWVLESLSISDVLGNHTVATKVGGNPLSTFNINVVNGKITVSPPVPSSLWFSAPESITKGQTYQLSPLLKFTNQSAENQNVTSNSLTRYSTSNPDLLLVSSKGLLTVPEQAGSGVVVIEVSYGNLTKQVEVKVNGGSGSMLQVSPLSSILQPGQAEQMKVVLIEDGARKNVTSSSSGVTYKSSNPLIVSVNKDGLILAASGDTQGTAEIQVSYGSIVSKTSVTVTKPVVKTLVISPSEENLSIINNKVQVVLKAFMTDGTTKDVTNSTEGTKYFSSNLASVQVSENGLISLAPSASSGEVTITAKNNLASVKTRIIVDVPDITELNVFPNDQSVYREDVIKLSAIGTYNDESEKDITNGEMGTTYISSVPSRAMVDANGTVTIPDSASYGNVTITVKNGSLQKSVILTVEEDQSELLKEIQVTTDINVLQRNGTSQLAVSGVYGNELEKDLTKGIEGTTYISSVPSRAMVDANGTVTIPPSASYGYVTITVKNGSLQKSVILTVEEDQSELLKEIQVTTDVNVLQRNGSGQLTVTGFYGNGSEKNLTTGTEGTTYISSVPSRAMVDANGTVTIPPSASYGNVTITVKNGSLQKSVILTVEENQSELLKDIQVATEVNVLQRNGSGQLTVTGFYGNGSEKDLTKGIEGTTYISSAPSRAMVDENGTVTIPPSASYGNVTITVKNGTLQENIILIIEEDLSGVLSDIKVTNEADVLQRNGQSQLTVMGFYGDGTEKDLTKGIEGTKYISSAPSRAMVDENGTVTIPPSASYGNVTITVKNGTLQMSLILTVEEDRSGILTDMQVLNVTDVMHRNGTTQLRVNGIYGEGHLKDITNADAGTIYKSLVPSRAMIDKDGRITIPSTASYGKVTITIQNGSIRKTLILIIN
ncbi:hypothetical protein [Paenisporosarcina sp. NPDC076898]|uniref:hypothetical protein n=1 Tax=unclassified Paenisporosarcina TaxID=2642018 RepID=UPI003D01B364